MAQSEGNSTVNAEALHWLLGNWTLPTGISPIATPAGDLSAATAATDVDPSDRTSDRMHHSMPTYTGTPNHPNVDLFYHSCTRQLAAAVLNFLLRLELPPLPWVITDCITPPVAAFATSDDAKQAAAGAPGRMSPMLLRVSRLCAALEVSCGIKCQHSSDGTICMDLLPYTEAQTAPSSRLVFELFHKVFTFLHCTGTSSDAMTLLSSSQRISLLERSAQFKLQRLLLTLTMTNTTPPAVAANAFWLWASKLCSKFCETGFALVDFTFDVGLNTALAVMHDLSGFGIVWVICLAYMDVSSLEEPMVRLRKDRRRSCREQALIAAGQQKLAHPAALCIIPCTFTNEDDDLRPLAPFGRCCRLAFDYFIADARSQGEISSPSTGVVAAGLPSVTTPALHASSSADGLPSNEKGTALKDIPWEPQAFHHFVQSLRLSAGSLESKAMRQCTDFFNCFVKSRCKLFHNLHFCGSLAKGTAVLGMSDLDLVFELQRSCYDPEDQAAYCFFVRQLIEQAVVAVGGSVVFQPRARMLNLELKLPQFDQPVSMDVLITAAITGDAFLAIPLWDERRLYGHHFYFSPVQTDYTRAMATRHTNKYTDAILLAKWWINQQSWSLPRKPHKPSSYMVELLCAHCATDCAKTPLSVIFGRFLRLAAQFSSLKLGVPVSVCIACWSGDVCSCVVAPHCCASRNGGLINRAGRQRCELLAASR